MVCLILFPFQILILYYITLCSVSCRSSVLLALLKCVYIHIDSYSNCILSLYILMILYYVYFILTSEVSTPTKSFLVLYNLVFLSIPRTLSTARWYICLPDSRCPLVKDWMFHSWSFFISSLSCQYRGLSIAWQYICLPDSRFPFLKD